MARKGLDPDCSIRVYRSFFKQVFKGPLSGWGRGKKPQLPPMWAAMATKISYILIFCHCYLGFLSKPWKLTYCYQQCITYSNKKY